jgi:hypothetical protein
MMLFPLVLGEVIGQQAVQMHMAGVSRNMPI